MFSLFGTSQQGKENAATSETDTRQELKKLIDSFVADSYRLISKDKNISKETYESNMSFAIAREVHNQALYCRFYAREFDEIIFAEHPLSLLSLQKASLQ